MAFDFKKEYREFYMPGNKPSLVMVPEMNYVAVRGKGDPNEEGGEYKRALNMLYSVSYTLKMSYKGDYRMDGYFQYVVPPLEGLWWNEDGSAPDFTDKSGFCWISMIRVPGFVKEKDVDWAKGELLRRKGMDCSDVGFLTFDEGLCVQIMHLGSYDDEPASIELMDGFIEAGGYSRDLSLARRHHEIYLSDPRRCAPGKCRTVIRIPVK